ncbi:MAG: hypothetical protein E6J90_41085 [Deltaproteobacteria bacterium]|nr:MAG: hypothetical protein E6J90_41085 [Deltaproteobacteria bacterium]TMQ12596.1 MAG: hypothetical protein E6J91_20500 [Deltaproteobacteria bacterium]
MTAAARNDLQRLLQQLFPTLRGLLAFARDAGGLTTRQLGESRDRDALAELLVDAAIRKGRLAPLLDALRTRFPRRGRDIDALGKALGKGAPRGARLGPARNQVTPAARGTQGTRIPVFKVKPPGKAGAGGARPSGATGARKAAAKRTAPGSAKTGAHKAPARRAAPTGLAKPTAPAGISKPAARKPSAAGSARKAAAKHAVPKGAASSVRKASAKRGAAKPPDGHRAKPPSTDGPGPAEHGTGAEAVPVSMIAAPAEPQHVNLGFATSEAPGTPLVDHTLGAGEWYVFWVKIEPRVVAGSLPGDQPLGGLHEGDILDVILFGFPRQLQLGPARHGRVQILATGNRVVQRAWADTPAALADTQLCFAVRTPWTFGRAGLRCNIYHRGVLLQSHLVTVEVTWSGRAQPGAARRVCDYNLSDSLDTSRFAPGTEHLLSVLVNDDGHGTHSFRFVSSKAGVPDQIHDGHIDDTQLARQVSYARTALQWVAWGSEGEWDEKTTSYRFINPPSAETSAQIYRMMAQRGANLWGQIVTNFGIAGPELAALRNAMRQPGRVQIALKSSPDAVVPMAMVYDYPLDPARESLTVCDASLAAIAAGKALETEPCFVGNCPHYDDDRVVCAGGFWGFRHELGLPIHIPKGEIATAIARGPAVRGFAPIYTDADFTLRQGHIDALKGLASDWLEVIDDRDVCITRLVGEARPLVYFYCHGGLTPTRTPFLKIGLEGSDIITAASFINKFLHWNEPTRPLVILNGCHTTGTSPEAMFSFLSALVSQGNAAGVIGTEITNFEPIAVQIGTDLVTRFLAGEEVGRALKLARLGLLRQGNPLGLMYIAFALPSLHLV